MLNATNEDSKTSNDYNSEEADITLISSDGVEFKVHSYILKAHSLALRPILCDPAFKPSPMTIDATCEDLTLFLHLMHNKPPHTVTDWSQAGKVLVLVDIYECDFASERLWVALQTIAVKEPWNAFVFSSQRDNLDLARKALSFMGNDLNRKKVTAKTLSFEDASSVALPYLLGWIPILAQPCYTYKHSSRANDWKSIAEEFCPVYPKAK